MIRVNQYYRNIVAILCASAVNFAAVNFAFAGQYENAMQYLKRGEYKQGIQLT